MSEEDVEDLFVELGQTPMDIKRVPSDIENEKVIVGGVLGGVCLLLLVIIVIVIVVRKR